MKRIGAAC